MSARRLPQDVHGEAFEASVLDALQYLVTKADAHEIRLERLETAVDQLAFNVDRLTDSVVMLSETAREQRTDLKQLATDLHQAQLAFMKLQTEVHTGIRMGWAVFGVLVAILLVLLGALVTG